MSEKKTLSAKNTTKEVLKWFEESNSSLSVMKPGAAYDVIVRALKIHLALIDGPSKEMAGVLEKLAEEQIMREEIDYEDGFGVHEMYDAMKKQLLKEVK